jgi:DNA polymerase I-like protein with 3'-5' exonuclease and polymerase domains
MGKEKVQGERNTLQELVITTELSQEQSWLEYTRLGYDLHSKNAELIFGKAWVDATEPGCTYYLTDGNENSMFKKCKCKGHQEMRDKSKAVSFGSIYGISFIKLAFNLKIHEEEAKFILKRFFEIVPGVAAMMSRFGNYAISKGHIVEPVFGRVRYFDQWKLAVPSEHGGIERAAFNTPIQSSGSAILKIAFVLMRRWINHNNLQKDVQLLLPYHDETIAQARPEYVALTKEKVAHYMQLAAKLAGFTIGASAKSGASWLEAH